LGQRLYCPQGELLHLSGWLAGWLVGWLLERVIVHE
jgi:hypothetical protein